jgi:hypothetical protein
MKTFLSLTFMLVALYLAPAQAQIVTPTKTPWRVDHVVIVVDNLSQAIKDFTALGFTVVPGGKPGGGFNQNALIPFLDGTYLELYSPIKPHMMRELIRLKSENKLGKWTGNLNAIETRFVNHVATGEGLADFALSKPALDLNEEIIDMHDLGLSLVGPIPMSRVRPDGKKLIWDVAIPETDSLPFLISDVTPRSLRLGVKRPSLQKNRVSGIASIAIAVDDLKTASQNYEALLGIKPMEHPPYIVPENVVIAVFNVGTVDIILAQSTDTKSPIHTYLMTHGQGPYHLTLYTTDKSFAGKLNDNLTHKTYIKLIYH